MNRAVFKFYWVHCLFFRPGSAFIGNTEICLDKRVQVTAKSDIVLVPGAYSVDILSKTVTGKRRKPHVVSVVEV